MVSVPINTYVAEVDVSTINPVTGDPLQFTGYPVSTDGLCPQPFGANSGPEFCRADCQNSCPSLNPNPMTGLVVDFAQTTDLISAVNTAINVNNVLKNANLAPLVAIGNIFFAAPPGTFDVVMTQVLNLIQTKLTLYWFIPTMWAVSHNFNFQLLLVE